MKTLTVRRQGQHITELQLENDREYFAGRSLDCDIVLDGKKGISRQHLKIYQEQGVWVVELLSKVGDLLLGKDTMTTLRLEKNCTFSVPPFEFEFTVSEDPAVEQPARDLTVHNSSPAHLDATVAATAQLIPYLKMTYGSGQSEILKLEGRLWVAGRDGTCEINLRNDHASRRHFEIVQTQEGFFISDLGSANGTLLNEEPLPANEPYQLASGDVIRVSDTRIQFEIHDLQFQNRVSQALPVHMPAPFPSPMPLGLPAPYFPQGNGPGAIKVSSSPSWRNINLETLKSIDYKKYKVRIAIGALLVVILYGLIFDGSEPVKIEEKDQASQSVTFESLSPQQKQAVKDSFNLAKTLYVQNKYQLCLAEIKKLHEIVPAYDNSREIENYCASGAQMVSKMIEDETRKQEAAEIQRVVQSIVDDCRQQMNDKTTLEELDNCLAPAVERDPENAQIQQLKQIVQDRMEEKARMAQAAQDLERRRRIGQGLLRQAQLYHKKGELAQAVNHYEKFIDGDYPSNSADKSQAQRDLASLRKELSSKVAEMLQSCKDNIQKMQFREAYSLCSNVVKQDPSNSEAEALKAQALNDLNRELKSSYQDSVLEESMGNVDTAKGKWKQIMEKAIPGSDYYNKAKRNLQKYGGG